MRNSFKRFGAMLMVLVMLLTMLPLSVFAAESIYLYVDTEAVRDGSGAEITGTPANGTIFYVPVMLSSAVSEFNSFNLQFVYDKATLGLDGTASFLGNPMFPTCISANASYNEQGGYGWYTEIAKPVVNTTEGIITWATDNAVVNDGTIPVIFVGFKVIGQSDAVADAIANIGVVSSVEGAPPLKGPNSDFSANDFVYEKPSDNEDEDDNEGEVTAAAYEIYYTLNSTTGVADKYYDYGVTDTVTAEIFLKSVDADVTVQAYDIYLDYNPKLTYAGTTMVGNPVQEGGIVSHIQLVKDSNKYIELAKGAVVSLGTVMFTISDTAEYGEDLAIKLVVGNDAENVTNISLADTATATTAGKAEAFYPVDKTEALGVEVNTVYAVSYNANAGGETVTGMPAAQEKQHGLSLTLSDAAPVRNGGWKFNGWNTKADGTGTAYAANAVYNANAAVTLYAQWEKTTATITFVNDDNSFLWSGDFAFGATPVYGGATPTKAADAQYTYAFAGWDPEIKPVDGAATYKATYTTTINKYTVTWVVEGEVVETDKEVEYGATPKYDGATPTKAADAQYKYEFKGWTPEIGTVEGDATYTAEFNAILQEYKVTFNVNGHGTAPATQTVQYGEKATNPGDLTADYYSFKGWYKDAECTEKFDFTAAITGDTTVYAKWEAIEYTISFNVNGGAMVGDQHTIKYTIEDEITLPTATKNGQNFGGWTVATAAGSWEINKVYSDTVAAGMYGDVNLNAVWTDKPLEIKGEGTNGTVSVSNADGVSGNKANVGDTINVTLNANNGYEFTADTVVTVTYNGNQTITATKTVEGTYSFVVPENIQNVEGVDATVSVEFTAVKYTISYELNGGTNNAANPEFYYITSDTITLADATKNGYEFKGWYTAATGGTKVETIALGSTGDVTLYAQWQVETYTITYMDGENTIGSATYTVEDAVTLKTDATKTGYTFAAWYANADLSGDAVATIAKGTTGDKIFYAKWTPNTDTAYKVEHYQQNLGADASNYESGYTLADTDNLTGTTGASVTPVVNSYIGFTAPATQTVEIKADGSTVVKYYYVRETYTITLDSNGGKYVEGYTAPTGYTYGEAVTLPNGNDLVKDGYSFAGWYAGETKVDGIAAGDYGDKELTARWTAVEYTITLKTNGGVIADTNWAKQADGVYTRTYTIESTYTLPGAEGKTNYSFANWQVTTAGGNWAADATVNSGYVLNKNFGDVTMDAQWNVAFKYEVEEYRYASTGYVMLRVATEGNANAYTFDGNAMYYTDADGYKLDGKNVFVTLIPATYVQGYELTADGVAKLVQGDASASATAIVRNGDVNGDGVVNIADANVVYQMVQYGGGYYGEGQLITYNRLVADMDDATANALYRGSEADVDAIVSLING